MWRRGWTRSRESAGVAGGEVFCGLGMAFFFLYIFIFYIYFLVLVSGGENSY